MHGLIQTADKRHVLPRPQGLKLAPFALDPHTGALLCFSRACADARMALDL